MESVKPDLVSIIIRIYDRKNFIESAVKSAKNQTYQNIEVLIIFDGESPELKQWLISRFSQENAKIIENHPHGRPFALNAGVKKASGQYLVFLDDDDVLHPEMISDCMNAVKIQNADLVTVGYRYFSKDEDVSDGSKHFISNKKNNILKDLISGNNFPINSILVRKNSIEKAGYFDKNLDAGEDWDLWLRIVAGGSKVENIEKCRSLIRIHGNNVSQNDVHMQKFRLSVLQKASSYLSVEQQKSLNLQTLISIRYLIYGWYQVINNQKKEGRLSLKKSTQAKRMATVPMLILYLLSHLPSSVLKSLTTGVEIILNRRNLHREFQINAD